jgi:hypothetical protein
MNWSSRRNGVAALVVAIVVAGFTAREARSTTQYHVRLDTSGLTGVPARIAFDFSGQSNLITIYDFEHDGLMGLPDTQGGIIIGDLMMSLNPSFITSMSSVGPDGSPFYFTSMVVNFDALGAAITFSLDLTELVLPDLPPDNLSLSVLGSMNLPLFDTADPLGPDALFSLDIIGVAGGELTVFAPMTFVAPDSLILQLPVTGVTPGTGATTRLRFRSVYPNPTAGGVHFEFEVPGAGGRARLAIYDLSGRLVERVFDGFHPGGLASMDWSGRDASHHPVPAGIYFARLEMGGQSTIRKVALGR